MSEATTETPRPDDFIRRSQLYRWHLQAGATYEEEYAAGTVRDYGAAGDDERELAGLLGLADLSTLPRIGFKGRGAPEWVQQHGVELSEVPNRAKLQSDGSLVSRLSQEELLVLASLSPPIRLIDTLRQNGSMDAAKGVYPLPRADSHCWFALTGIHAAETLSKVCGVDLRTTQFAQGEVAQTSLARVNAIIIRHDLADTPCFYILSDVSTAEFLWTCLLDAMLEFDGGPVGMAALRALANGEAGTSV